MQYKFIGVLVVAATACQLVYAAPDAPQVDWLTLQAALASPAVKTIDDLRQALIAAPHGGKVHKMSGKDSVSGISSYYKFAYYEDQERDVIAAQKHVEKSQVSLAEVRKEIGDKIIWKDFHANLDRVSRQYLVNAEVVVEAEFANAWEPIIFDVFTDDKGTILGWQHTDLPTTFTMVIINGKRTELPGSEVNGATIELVSFGMIPPAGYKKGLFTVHYEDGPKANPRGTLELTKAVEIRNAMIFEVSPKK
jgi:hypothetical protein